MFNGSEQASEATDRIEGQSPAAWCGQAREQCYGAWRAQPGDHLYDPQAVWAGALPSAITATSGPLAWVDTRSMAASSVSTSSSPSDGDGGLDFMQVP